MVKKVLLQVVTFAIASRSLAYESFQLVDLGTMANEDESTGAKNCKLTFIILCGVYLGVLTAGDMIFKCLGSTISAAVFSSVFKLLGIYTSLRVKCRSKNRSLGVFE